jgi:hypothetical protein
LEEFESVPFSVTVPHIYDYVDDQFTFTQLFDNFNVDSTYSILIRVPEGANMRMTEICTAEAFCLTFPMHFLIFAQISTQLDLNDAVDVVPRDIVISDI